jgi:Xaa-Pro aminopeptidase
VTRSDYARRCSLATSSLAGRKLDALLVSSAANIRYLTGFTGSSGLVLLGQNSTVLFTDPRYGIQASEEASCAVRVWRGSPYDALAKWLRGKGIRRLGVEKKHLSHDSFLSLKEQTPSGLRLAPVAGLVEDLRMVKSPEEIDLIRRAVRLNSEAYEGVIQRARPGISELDLAAELEYRMRRLGAEKPAFETIVASGRRSALPHASPTSKLLGHNELLLVDMGATRDGYSSDMTRVAFFGRPGARVRKLHRAVLEALEAAKAAVREGVAAETVDGAARRVLKALGLNRAFVHACGHGLGLEIHEAPRLGRRNKARLKVGMAVTLEPGVYLQEFGGIRIEDTVVVTRSGCEVLTPTSKELLSL